MRTMKVGVSASGAASRTLPLNQYAGEFNVGWAVVATGNDFKYSVQKTFDDPQSDASLTWFDIVSAQTTNNNGQVVQPCQALRVVFASASASDVHITVIQAGV